MAQPFFMHAAALAIACRRVGDCMRLRWRLHAAALAIACGRMTPSLVFPTESRHSFFPTGEKKVSPTGEKSGFFVAGK